MTNSERLSDEALQAAVAEIGPWHHRIRLRGDIWTTEERKADQTGARPTLVDPVKSFAKQVGAAFPEGLQGRSFLDCGCNCGGYGFAAKDAGAGRVLGFDVRDHWINQARFIQTHREADNSGTEFRVADLVTIGDLGETFDVTWFSGIFYHLPDPVASMKLMADRTGEIFLLNTACAPLPEDAPEVPSLIYKLEGTRQLMSGVHAISWLPSGPVVLCNILDWLGFAETRVVLWTQPPREQDFRLNRRFGRISIVAAREKGRLAKVPGVSAPSERVYQT